MDTLKDAKLELCNNMATLLEGLDIETSEALINWLVQLRVRGAHHCKFWLDEAKFIEFMA